MLSGNRNFEARIHPNIKANFLASPPLVVAYALAGTITRDLMTEPVGQGKHGDVWLGDIWPSTEEIDALLKFALDPKAFQANYGQVKSNPGELWEHIKGVTGDTYNWPDSTYIAEPPFFQDFGMTPGATPTVKRARAGRVRRLGHHRPHLAGRLHQGNLARRQVAQGTRRDEGRLQQLRLAPRPRDHDARHLRQRAHQEPHDSRAAGRQPIRSGETLFQPTGEQMSIYDAAMKYVAAGTPTVVFGESTAPARRATGPPRAPSCWA